MYLFLLLFLFWNVEAFREQSVNVKGIINCRGYTQPGTFVQLYDEDTVPLFDSDDLLGSANADDRGIFCVKGSAYEITDLDPYIFIEHNCGYEGLDQKRFYSHSIPAEYVSDGNISTRIYHMGDIELFEKGSPIKSYDRVYHHSAHSIIHQTHTKTHQQRLEECIPLYVAYKSYYEQEVYQTTSLEISKVLDSSLEDDTILDASDNMGTILPTPTTTSTMLPTVIVSDVMRGDLPDFELKPELVGQQTDVETVEETQLHEEKTRLEELNRQEEKIREDERRRESELAREKERLQEEERVRQEELAREQQRLRDEEKRRLEIIRLEKLRIEEEQRKQEIEQRKREYEKRMEEYRQKVKEREEEIKRNEEKQRKEEEEKTQKKIEKKFDPCIQREYRIARVPEKQRTFPFDDPCAK